MIQAFVNHPIHGTLVVVRICCDAVRLFLALQVNFTQSIRLPKLGAKPTYRGHHQSVENDP
jgi:hypothetical protein